jgi:activator of 2-hydroxyglutaryl-CoA dehydratase
MISGMEKALEAVIGHPVSPVPNPQYTGALGAAILAARR